MKKKTIIPQHYPLWVVEIRDGSGSATYLPIIGWIAQDAQWLNPVVVEHNGATRYRPAVGVGTWSITDEKN